MTPPRDPSNGSRHAATVMWRSAGLFFLFPGVVALAKSGAALPGQILGAVGCAVGLAMLLRRRWPSGLRRFGMAIPTLAALNLLGFAATGGALPIWEIVLWYAAGIMWVGLTQPAWWLWVAPLYALSFCLTAERPFAPATLYAAALTVGVMATIGHVVGRETARGRRAYDRVRHGVEIMTAVARTGKTSPRTRPSEIHQATAATALELGFGGAGVASLLLSRRKWEWRSREGEPIPASWEADLERRLFRTARESRVDRLQRGGGESVLLPLFRSGDTAYVLAAESPRPVAPEEAQALELLAAQTARGLEILRMAYYDELTNLPNRSLFQDRLRELLTRARRDADFCFGLLYLDVDRFKTINDLHGHAVGDRFLAELASRLRNGVRGLDYVSHRDTPTSSRLGGDEFAVLLPHLRSPEDAAVLAERLCALLSAPFAVDGRELETRPSIGMVLYDRRYREPTDMMRDADSAMFRAKRSDREHWAIFDSAMRVSVDRALQLEASLPRAIERGELYLQYQPIVQAGAGHPVGFEALLRWRHPELGAISPGEFIPLAEATGSIGELGRWVFEHALAQIGEWSRTWRQAPPLYVSVNLSRKQVGDRTLPERLRDLLDRGGVAPEQLVVEITEGLALTDLDETRHFLLELREVGVRLALDDFGTGYSSLSCLHELPVQILKLDREFVVAAEKEQRALDTVDGAVRMAHAMGLKVVAEGVEEPAQQALLERMSCDFFQGFLHAPPLDPSEAERWLRERAALEPSDPD